MATSVEAEAAKRPGNAIQLLRENASGDAMELDHDVLYQALCHPGIGRRPISVVGVAGAFRTGKSFLLNFFLRYLRNEGYDTPSGDWMGDANIPLNEGFAWRGGSDRHTIGIWIWSKPFIVKQNGREVAVLLLDTQGNFDPRSGKEKSTVAFAISLLLSSVFVFNVNGRVQETDLEYLQFCIGYSEMARQDNHGRVMFQALTFLIRDWSDESKYDYGSDGGMQYLENRILHEVPGDVNAPLARVREKLRDSFKTVDCYLMPYPGQKVAVTSKKYEFKGCLEDIDKEFVDHVNKLCDHLLNPNNLVTKNEMMGGALMNFIIGVFDYMKENKGNLPQMKNLLELEIDCITSHKLFECAQEYNQKMEEVTRDGFVPWVEFQQKEKEVYGEVLQKFIDSLPTHDEQTVKQQKERFRKHVSIGNIPKMENELSELIEREKVTIEALRLIDEYEAKMESVAKNLDESNLFREHKLLNDGAVKQFRSNQESNYWFEKGLRLLRDGIEYAHQLLLSKFYVDQEVSNGKIKNLVCASVDLYQEKKKGFRSGKLTISVDRANTKARDAAMSHFKSKAEKFASKQDMEKGIGMLDNFLSAFSTPEKQEGNSMMQKLHLKYDQFVFGKTGDKVASEKMIRSADQKFSENAMSIYESLKKPGSDADLTFGQWRSEQQVALDRHIRRNDLLELRYEVENFQLKQRIAGEIYEDAKKMNKLFLGDVLEERLKEMREKYLVEFTYLKKKYFLVPSDATRGVCDMADEMFHVLRKRDETYQPYQEAQLQADLKVRKLKYLNGMKEQLNGAYALPKNLARIHEIMTESLLPDVEVEGQKADILARHREDVQKELDHLFEEFKKWNLANKKIFRRVLGDIFGNTTLAFSGVGGISTGIAIAVGASAIAAVVSSAGLGAMAGIFIVGVGTTVVAWRAHKKKKPAKFFSSKFIEVGKKAEKNKDQE